MGKTKNKRSDKKKKSLAKPSAKLTEQDIKNVLTPLTDEQIDKLSPGELKVLLKGEQKIREFYREAAETALALNKELEDKVLNIESVLVRLKSRLFNPKSERSKLEKKQNKEGSNVAGAENSPFYNGKARPLKKDKDLTNRYPNAEVIESVATMEHLPTCECCNNLMAEMNIYEQSQHLVVIPKQYLIKKVLRMKYHCPHCHSSIKTTPPVPKIIPKSSYGDEFLIDVALSKCCDLIPVERYCEMAGRQGFAGLPANSLHEGLYRSSQFYLKIYELIRTETLDARILAGDETTHRMLEGHEIKRWYLWGFFCATACFYEIHETRSGDVAGDVLSESSCEFFLSDAYTGYGKAIREANELRALAELTLITESLCNAHSRRYFDECGEMPDAQCFVSEYRKIFHREKEVKELLKTNRSIAATKRAEGRMEFEVMKKKADEDLAKHSSYSNYYKACQYFLNNYEGLTVCLTDPEIPLDNNISERGLRSSVVGRKTWYGTHSEKAAEALAIHFTIIESCKLNGVNPRDYYKDMTEAIHYKKTLLTPSQYKKKITETTS